MEYLQTSYVAAENGKYTIKQEHLPSTAPPGKVLIKMEYSTCNPHDGIVFARYLDEGHRLGIEGCGTVISVGEGADTGLLNKKVSVSTDGCWANYILVDAAKTHIIVLDDQTDMRQAAAAWVNPLTALAQLDVIKQKATKAYVADAAASSLNRMVIQLCHQEDITPINIVRKAADAQMLREKYGVKHVLLQDSPTFLKDLQSLIAQYEPRVFFDVVGGDSPVTVPIFEAMPNCSSMVIVANLTNTPIPINSRVLMYQQKQIHGLLCFNWAAQASNEAKRVANAKIVEDLRSGGRIFRSNFTTEVHLTQWQEAIRTYKEVASKDNGKILINLAMRKYSNTFRGLRRFLF